MKGKRKEHILTRVTEDIVADIPTLLKLQHAHIGTIDLFIGVKGGGGGKNGSLIMNMLVAN